MLFIGEKPSIAEAIAKALSNGSYQRGQSHATPVYEFQYNGQRATATSVAGHVFSINFVAALQPWGTDEEKLFQRGQIEQELSKGAGPILSQLRSLTSSATKIILALDNDREGENICFEIINNLKLPLQKVFRLRFSALTSTEITRCLNKLDKPDRNLSDSVEVRQELDLKIGVAFTRFQTKFFHEKYSNLNTKCVSYGPCQTPTLNFCVERQEEILHFKPQKLYGVKIYFKGFEIQFDEEFKTKEEADAIRDKLIKQSAKVTSQKITKEKSVRPIALNTVALLKKASEKLHMSPTEALHKAEQLYLEGYTTYPRTESSTYPSSFDFKEILDQLAQVQTFKQCVQSITQFNPRKGVDAGDHPPITPTNKHMGSQDGFYNLIARNFIASLMPDAEYEVLHSTIEIGGYKLQFKSRRYTCEGWHAIYKNTNMNDEEQDLQCATLNLNQELEIDQVVVTERFTKPPGHLTESQLLSLMEKNQIGTDASMATHIQNICDRNYVTLGQNRTLLPTELGVQLINGLKIIDKELVSPKLRAGMEADMNLVAIGKIKKEAMLAEQLDKYLMKFRFFKQNIALMDQLFESKFITLKQAGKPFVQCGQCYKFTKLISQVPQRIYCPTCDRMYQLVQNGKIQEQGNRSCGLCGQKILCSVISGKDKRTLFCPKCYTDGHDEMDQMLEDFEGVKVKGAKNLSCHGCLKKECEMSLWNKYVGECTECAGEECGFDVRMSEKKESQKETTEKVAEKPKEEKKNDPLDIVITFDEINIEIEAPKGTNKPQTTKGNDKPVQNKEHLTHKLYLDNISLQQAQILCTSCQFVANLPLGKAEMVNEHCEECDRKLIKIVTKEKEFTQCAFCEMEGVEFANSKFVHSDLKKNRFKGKGKQHGKGRHK
ncbi:DNA_topoisomerase [Hexamita inflata]|uniref:DNA topoisomerase n=1 Tax=Hexamita inflata TaxID=28002 RepID=A0ABP1HAS0_9EUKA